MGRSDKPSASPEVPKSVLMLRFSAIGDVAMSIPVVYDACLSHPDTQFIFVTRKPYSEIFLNAPRNLKVVETDLKHFGGLGGLWRLFRQMRREYPEVDFVADLHDVIRTKLLRLFYRLHKVKVGVIDKGRKDKRALVRKKNKQLRPLTPTTERYRKTLKDGNVSTTGLFRSIFPPRAKEHRHPRNEDWVAIAPFAKHPGKIYPVELMEQVVAHFGRRINTRVFLFGGGEEETAVLQEWCRKYPNCENMAKKKSGFAAEMRLISRCDVMLSMDSGNMHLASVSGVRTVSLWGATHPYAGFGGWMQREEDELQSGLACRPCSIYGNRPCRRGDFLCLHAVRARNVIKKIEKILRET